MRDAKQKVARALAGKETKQQAKYSTGTPAEHCAICEYFEKPNRCDIVAGEISPQGWCRHFEED